MDALDGSSGGYPISEGFPWGAGGSIDDGLVAEADDLISGLDELDLDTVDEFPGAEVDRETLAAVIDGYRAVSQL